MTTNSNYSDLDLTFNPNPITGDLMLTKGSVSVIRALKNLLLTNHYEVPFSPQYGSNIRQLLFEPMTPFTASTLQKEITYTIANFEHRISINKLTVTADYANDGYVVYLECYIQNLVEPFTVNFLLSRLR